MANSSISAIAAKLRRSLWVKKKIELRSAGRQAT
jgi:hypothetical protein